MNKKDRLFSFLDIVIQCIKYRGIVNAFYLIYYYCKFRFVSKKNQLNYSIFGFSIKALDTQSILNLLFELFGLNLYYFIFKNPHPVILDIGANIGDSVLYFKWLYPDSRIYAFEPHPVAYQLLVDNIKNNKLTSVTSYNVALGNENKSIILKSDDKTFESSTTKDAGSRRKRLDKSYKVKFQKLTGFKEISELETIDLLKIDIEGGEADLFHDLDPLLPKIRKIIFEFHLLDKIKDNSFDDIISKLKKYKYQISITGFYRNYSNFTNPFVFLVIAQKNI